MIWPRFLRLALLLAVLAGTAFHPVYADQSQSFVIGGFDLARGGSCSYPEGDLHDDLRTSLASHFPEVSWVSFSSLTPATLEGVDAVMLTSCTSNNSAIDPLTPEEQTTLFDFVAAGGCAILLPDNDAFAAGADAANESLVDPFGLDTAGTIFGSEVATVYDPTGTSVTGGIYGPYAEFGLAYPGGIDNLGPNAVSLATNPLGDALALIEPGALTSDSGPVIVYSDHDTFNDQWGWFPQHEALFLNTIEYCQSHEAVNPGWEWVDTNPAISRWSAAMAYDSDRHRMVLFGGRSANPCCDLLSDTWEFVDGAWTQVTTTSAPEPRIWHDMVYDSHRQRTVLYGGFDPDTSTYFPGTWEYDGTDWQLINTVTSPPEMVLRTMVFDSVRNRVVLFGGESDQGPFNDTWEYDGLDWTMVTTPTSPPFPYALASMAFDAGRGKTVLVFDAGTNLATWEYDGLDWAEIPTATSPSTRWAHDMAYDAIRDRVVLFGGYSPVLNNITHDTWEYDGFDWSLVLSPVIPGQREQHTMAYDLHRRKVMVVGGVGYTSGDDTWVFDDREALYCFKFEGPEGIEITAVLPDKTVVGTWRNWDNGGSTAPVLGGYSGKDATPRLSWLAARFTEDFPLWSLNFNMDTKTYDGWLHFPDLTIQQVADDAPFWVIPGICPF